MIRGTTASFFYHLPCQKSDVVKAEIWFWQDNNEGTNEIKMPITKYLTDCSESEDSRTLCIVLNQIETLAFRIDRKAYSQIRILLNSGAIYASRKETVPVYDIPSDTILTPDE